MKVIGICGLKRSGKDTIARYLCKYGYHHMKISQPLKDGIKSMFGFSYDQMESFKEDVDPYWNVKPREVMQFIGTEMMQYKIQEIMPDIGRKFWVKSIVTKIKDEEKPVVLSDLRFLHEVQELKKHFDVYIIKIVKDDVDSSDVHCSEREYLDIKEDMLIYNNSTIDELFKKIDKIKFIQN